MVTTIAVISVIAILFGLIWVVTNLYTFSPVYRRALLRFLGTGRDPRVFSTGSTLPDGKFPTVDVLLPAYDERETIAHSIRALSEADYPAAKLSVNVIVEASDTQTRGELARLRRLYDFEEVVVPPSYPGRRNKPRALDFGFQQTSGDIVGVIDAEDVVAPELFRQVVAALVENDYDYAQGRLDMQNEDDGFLNTLFRGEYGFWYGTVVPSFFRVGYPVPLGGTTNFAHRHVLEAIAEERVDRFGSPWSPEELAALESSGYRDVAPWDPRNVTEDFELGLFLWESGFHMAMVTAVTRGESPVTLNGWIRQRTRWQKGKLYTFLQRVRTPPRGLGRRLHVYTQSAAPHLGPINIVGVVILGMYAWTVGFRGSWVVTSVLLLGFAFALQQLGMQAYGYWSITDRRGGIRLLRAVTNFAGLPLYWVLIWGSDIRAFAQLTVAQLEWDKTRHDGRHLTEDRVAGVETMMSLAGLRLVIVRASDGWTWEIRDHETTLARAGTVYTTKARALSAAEAFGEAVDLAVNPHLRFGIDRQQGWQWSLIGEGIEAHGPEPTADKQQVLDAVGQTKTAAGVAVLR